MSKQARPSVLFVCVKNAGKSQMAAGLMRQAAGDAVDVYSAGTTPGTEVNSLSAEALGKIGVDIGDEKPKSIDPDVVKAVDLVVILGREARVEAALGTEIETWDTDEPSDRGIDGIERMRLVRDDIAHRVATLLARLTSDSSWKPGSGRRRPTDLMLRTGVNSASNRVQHRAWLR